MVTATVPLIAIAIAVGIAIAGNRLRSIALPIVLSVMYALPAVMIAWVGNENFSIECMQSCRCSGSPVRDQVRGDGRCRARGSGR